MNMVTTEFGRRTSLKAIPSKEPPMNLERFLREHGEEMLGRMMRATEARRVLWRQNPTRSRGTVCHRVAALIEEAGEATAQDISEGIGITVDHARTCLRDLYKAGEVQRRAVLPEGANTRHYVWSLVEAN